MKIKNIKLNFKKIFAICIIFLLISSFSFTSSSSIKFNNIKTSEHLIYGTATYDDGGGATGARVDIISIYGKLTTWVNSDDYWEINCGDPGPNWPIGIKFTVYLTGCCSHGGWTGSASDIISGTYNNMGNIILYPNSPPNIPSIPLGPIAIQIGSIGTYKTNATDINALNKIKYRFDWDAEGSHNYSQYTPYVNSGEYANKSHYWETPGTYIVKAQTKDEHGAISDWSEGLSVIIYENNNPPEIPIINGPSQGIEDKIYYFNISTTDLDSDFIRYFVEWGDGNSTGWIGPYESGELVLLSHKWGKKGTYNIRLKAKDIYEVESQWSESFSIKIVSPIIIIDKITVKLSQIRVKISNIGDGSASYINWNILLNGGYIFSGQNNSGEIEYIEPGGHVIISSNLIFGFSGRTIIVITVNIKDQNSLKEEVESSIFMFFIKLKN